MIRTQIEIETLTGGVRILSKESPRTAARQHEDGQVVPSCHVLHGGASERASEIHRLALTSP